MTCKCKIENNKNCPHSHETHAVIISAEPNDLAVYINKYDYPEFWAKVKYPNGNRYLVNGHAILLLQKKPSFQVGTFARSHSLFSNRKTTVFANTKAASIRNDSNVLIIKKENKKYPSQKFLTFSITQKELLQKRSFHSHDTIFHRKNIFMETENFSNDISEKQLSEDVDSFLEEISFSKISTLGISRSGNNILISFAKGLVKENKFLPFEQNGKNLALISTTSTNEKGDIYTFPANTLFKEIHSLDKGFKWIGLDYHGKVYFIIFEQDQTIRINKQTVKDLFVDKFAVNEDCPKDCAFIATETSKDENGNKVKSTGVYHILLDKRDWKNGKYRFRKIKDNIEIPTIFQFDDDNVALVNIHQNKREHQDINKNPNTILFDLKTISTMVSWIKIITGLKLPQKETFPFLRLFLAKVVTPMWKVQFNLQKDTKQQRFW